ncbi:group III truncated hemoglobin [Lutibacter sp.]
MKDIENRQDIYVLMKKFYVKLMSDEEMKHFFTAFLDKNLLEEHLQTLVDFWDNILFYSGAYQKNAMRPHLQLQKQHPFSKNHFQKWLSHFNASVDELFEGEVAHTAKSRALSIATVMQIKISELNNR